jgi:hypothetical protein
LYESFNQMALPKGWSRWAKSGDIVSHPKPVFGRIDPTNASSSRFLEDGSYVRLRNITLGYDLAPQITSKVKIGGARIFISGDNLWTATNYSGTDPEVVLGSGVSSFRYPISRKILVGLNVTF